MVNDEIRPINYQKLMGWVLLLAGVLSVLWDGWLIGNSVATRSWETTEGLVYSSEIVFTTANLGTRSSAFYRPDITYRYRIEGTVYTGNNIYYSDISFLSLEAAGKLIDQYPIGRVITVYYNPRDAEETVLLPEPSPIMWMLLGPAVLFLVLGQRVLRQKSNR